MWLRLLVDLNLLGKEAVVIAEGGELEKRTRQLLDAGAKVTVVCSQLPKNLKTLKVSGSIDVHLFRESADYLEFFRASSPYLVVVSTGDSNLDKKIVDIARSNGALVYVVDRPGFNDFNMPAVAKIGKEIRVAISTGGSSPAMASILRKRIERLIGPEDILQVEFQRKIKGAIRRSLSDSASRKKVIYELLRNKKIAKLLKEARMDEARDYALNKIQHM